jgi:methionine sulfoxide reductase heme-binding subunit
MGPRVPRPAPAEKHVRSSYWRRRVRRHVGLALASAVLMVGVFYLVRSDFIWFRLSMASAYAGLALLGATLATGPWNVLTGRPNPVSTDLRRDIGIWAGILGLIHVAVGLQVHAGGDIWLYFFHPPAPQRLIVRLDPAGFSNHSGLIATLILAILLALSNDCSLRWFGRTRWKMVHRSVYVAFALIVAHGALYQLLEKRILPFVGLFLAMVAAVTAIQLAGVRRMRARARRATSGASVPTSSSDG